MIDIHFNRDKCIGCGICAEEAPDRWRMNFSDGRSVLINGIQKNGRYRTSIFEDELEANKLAESSCPAKVIKVSE